MFDILVFLFENYVQTEAFLEPRQLADELTEAGFDRSDVRDALDWLAGMGADRVPMAAAPGANSVRVYDATELGRLDAKCRGLLMFLESAGVLDALSRELIIERAMALADEDVTLSNLKVIVLLALWSTGHTDIDTLILDELLDGDDDDDRVLH